MPGKQPCIASGVNAGVVAEEASSTVLSSTGIGFAELLAGRPKKRSESVRAGCSSDSGEALVSVSISVDGARAVSDVAVVEAGEAFPKPVIGVFGAAVAAAGA